MLEKVNQKIIFFGTPNFAAGILKALVENGFYIAAVLTQSDKEVGRQQKVVFSPVKKLAIENKIKVFQPENLKENELFRKIKDIKPGLFIVAAYGKILPKKILEIPTRGAINIHASLLPKYRGASPVQCAILAGDQKTGITLIQMNEKMDEGGILAQEKIKIGEKETAERLMMRLEKLGARMIIKFIPDWISGKIKPIAQDQKQATCCQSIQREDGKIDWNSTAREIYRKWRAYYPWPGIFAFYEAKNRLQRMKLSEIEIILNVATGENPGKIIKYRKGIAVQTRAGLIILKKIQIEGKKEMTVDEFIRGNQDFVSQTLK